MEILGKLEEITDLKTVWNHEASEFTPWLAANENIALLADALDLEIAVDETESQVGNFRADILAKEAGTGRKIIIENQLEDTNHDHLGKLITYAAGKSADIIIWLVKHAREEHRAAVAWLNNHTDEKIGFFLCEIKIYRIGDSAPAVKFEVVERPNDWAKELRTTEITEKQQACYDYWYAFLEFASQNETFKDNFFKRPSPSTKTEIYFAMGTAACRMTVSQVRRRNKIEVYLRVFDNMKFKELVDNKDAIESEAGLNFDWQEESENKARRIIVAKQVSFDDEAARQEQFDWLIDVMLKMKKTFSHYF